MEGIMKLRYLFLLAVCAFVFALSCSNPEDEYGRIQELQDSKALLLTQDMDYDIKISACDAVITALDNYLAQHKKGKWHDTALLAFYDWQNKRQSILEEQAYSRLQVILTSSEQVMSTSGDYDIKIKGCDDAINAIQEFLQKFDDGRLASTMQTSLVSWQQRKSACQEEFTTLVGNFSKISQEHAMELAGDQHKMSSVERIELTSRKQHKDGNKIILNDVYDVRMRGLVLGTSIFKLKVYVNGYISMDKKTVGIYNDAYVEE
jgi:hypothetical protein